MKEIIMIILNMINDGKITADEGVALIGAVKSSGVYSRETAAAVKKRVKKAIEDAEPKIKQAGEKIALKSGEVMRDISNGVKTMKDNAAAKKAAAVEADAAEDMEESEDELIVDINTGIPDDDSEKVTETDTDDLINN
jgi:type IV secretory pathway TrbL component